MHNQVFADIEIEDQKIPYYSSVMIRQKFNAHHEFLIRIRYDVLGTIGEYSITNAQKLIGKSTCIKLCAAGSMETAYEFRGIICEICLEQSDNFTSDLVLKGYSPTILLENGPHFLSFYQNTLEDVANKTMQVLAQANCRLNIAPQYKTAITYVCQYRESTFNFLNRLSSDYGEWFYYNGQELFFGKPASSPEVEITYGEDVHNIQFSLRILPMTFTAYSYISKDDELVSSESPSSIDGLDEYASHALSESGKVFSEPVNFPNRQRVNTKSDLDEFVKKQKASMAANLEILTGGSDNPLLHIGSVANIRYSKLEDDVLVKEEYGKFLITSIEHHVTANGKYYNSFEGIPSGMEIIPVKNVLIPIAETQIATVTDNKDPDNMGRVRVQMLWQQPINEMTDFIRVSTPDAGGGKDGAKNRGLVVVPEPGDQVVVCFRYNDPERPFVMGSMFHGKTGGGGGEGNNTKSLNSKSGHTVTLNDAAGITIVDKTGNNKIDIDGTNTISVTADLKIVLSNGSSTLTMEGDTITLSAAHINIEGTADAELHSAAHGFVCNSGGDVFVSGTNSTMTGTAEAAVSGATTIINGDTEVTLSGGKATVSGTSEATFTSTGASSIQGAIVKLN